MSALGSIEQNKTAAVGFEVLAHVWKHVLTSDQKVAGRGLEDLALVEGTFFFDRLLNGSQKEHQHFGEASNTHFRGLGIQGQRVNGKPIP